MRERVQRVGLALERLGHHVERADPTYGIFGAGVLPRSSAGLSPWLEKIADHSRLDERTRHNARLGRLLGPLLGAGRALEGPMRWQVGAIFKRFDVVLTPTTAQPALPVGSIDGLSNWETDKVIVGACPYTWPWNALGWPGVSVPAGLTDAGLPVGAQLLARANEEPLLIALAAQLERECRWHERRAQRSEA